MKTNLFICFFSCLFSTIIAQDKPLNFPDDFLGSYAGKIIINNAHGRQEVAMEFHLKKTSVANKYDYILVYNKQPRNYTLVVTDKEKGIYNIDENNGIVLPAKLHNNILYSFFEVNDNFLSSRLAFHQNSIDFEILFSNTKNKTVTGDDNSKKTLEVFGYPITTVQSALLIKKD